jgi:hypothetical protein
VKYIFDIDGTICTQSNPDYENAKPFIERITKINQLYLDGHTIIFQTARGMGRSNNNQKEAIDLMYEFTKKQLDSWGVKYHELFLGKPAGDIYIDDKGVNDEDFFTH